MLNHAIIAATLLSHVVCARTCAHLGVARAAPGTGVVWPRPQRRGMAADLGKISNEMKPSLCDQVS